MGVADGGCGGGQVPAMGVADEGVGRQVLEDGYGWWGSGGTGAFRVGVADEGVGGQESKDGGGRCMGFWGTGEDACS